MAERRFPEFPPPSVVAKAMELGPGTGPWSRSDLDDLWGAAAASRFIHDAKAAGYLLAPSRNAFHVPSARDLMLVSWLTGVERTEFIISRTLALTGQPYWCLSAWARALDLEFPGPLFVVEIKHEAEPDGVAPGISQPPYLDNLLIVPKLPLSRSAEVRSRVGLPPSDPGDPITFILSADVADAGWTAALCLTLGLPRLKKKVKDILDRGPAPARREDPARRAERWTRTLGQPQPNRPWRQAITSQRPFLLVPDSIWRLITSSRRARLHADLAGLPSA